MDLDKKSHGLYQKTGSEATQLLFVQLESGEHPFYPEGSKDKRILMNWVHAKGHRSCWQISVF